MAKKQAPCNNCGKTITRSPSSIKSNHMIFCNRHCFGEWKSKNWQGENGPNWKSKPILICSFCGKPLDKRLNRGLDHKEHFCNMECRKKWDSKNRIGEKAPQWKGGEKQVSCCICGKKITRSYNEVIKRSKRFSCSKECNNKLKSQNMTGNKSHRWKGNHVIVKCAQCGIFIDKPAWWAKRKSRFFCNNKCRGKWNSINRTGENNPSWKGGHPSYYGPNWLKQREHAKQRDQYTCQKCGFIENDTEREYHIHHIKPFQEFGYIFGLNKNYKDANHINNLITLCAGCHTKIENNPSLLSH